MQNIKQIKKYQMNIDNIENGYGSGYKIKRLAIPLQNCLELL